MFYSFMVWQQIVDIFPINVLKHILNITLVNLKKKIIFIIPRIKKYSNINYFIKLKTRLWIIYFWNK